MRVLHILPACLLIAACNPLLPPGDGTTASGAMAEPRRAPQVSSVMPENGTREQERIAAYIRANINVLSPVAPVLGGTFFVTDIASNPDGTATVRYEDGHIALTARVRGRMTGDAVLIESFDVLGDIPSAAAGESGALSSTSPAQNAAGMANPASVNCEELGGTLRIERKPPSGSEFGVCLFPGNRQCEEWALKRGECPRGGVAVSGYATPASRYCAIVGGRYAATGMNGEEQGACTLPSGTKCDAWELWDGRCPGA